MTDGCDVSSEITFSWTSLDLSDDKSTLVKVMACCLTAPSHYLNQRWPRLISPYGVIRPQWVMIIQHYRYIIDNIIVLAGNPVTYWWACISYISSGHRHTINILHLWDVELCMYTQRTESNRHVKLFATVGRHYMHMHQYTCTSGIRHDVFTLN